MDALSGHIWYHCRRFADGHADGLRHGGCLPDGSAGFIGWLPRFWQVA